MAGLLGGFISGLMAVGTAAIYVPLMLYLGYGQLFAQSIALWMIVPASFISIFVYYKHGTIKVKGSLILLIPAILASLVGSYMASILPVIVLRKLFGICMVYIAYKVWRS
jgi:uncharacterized membrane protein YfcA